MSMMVTYPQVDPGTTLTPARSGPVRDLFRRLFDRGLFLGGDRDVVTSQWAPAVDIREEVDRFVLYADLQLVIPKRSELQPRRPGRLAVLRGCARRPVRWAAFFQLACREPRPGERVETGTSAVDWRFSSSCA